MSLFGQPFGTNYTDLQKPILAATSSYATSSASTTEDSTHP